MAYIEAQTWKRSPTDAKIQFIKDVWEPGMSAKQIAGAISKLARHGVTRNAVIGIYTRHADALKDQYLNMVPLSFRAAHMNRRGKRQDGTTNPKPRRVRVASIKPPKPIVFLYTDAPESFNKMFVDLNKFECKWETTNSHSAADFRFCGHHAPVGPWCSFHASKAKGAA